VVLGAQLRRCFDVCGINEDALHWADFNALRRLKMSDALGAFAGGDVVELLPWIDCPVWTNRLADIAVNALVGNKKGHEALLEISADGSKYARPMPG
jgi:hypothetical protein